MMSLRQQNLRGMSPLNNFIFWRHQIKVVSKKQLHKDLALLMWLYEEIEIKGRDMDRDTIKKECDIYNYSQTEKALERLYKNCMIEVQPKNINNRIKYVYKILDQARDKIQKSMKELKVNDKKTTI